LQSTNDATENQQTTQLQSLIATNIEQTTVEQQFLIVFFLPDGTAGCWNLLSAAKKPTRVNSGDNRVACSGAIALLI
jgi:hypothetical protein